MRYAFMFILICSNKAYLWLDNFFSHLTFLNMLSFSAKTLKSQSHKEKCRSRLENSHRSQTVKTVNGSRRFSS